MHVRSSSGECVHWRAVACICLRACVFACECACMIGARPRLFGRVSAPVCATVRFSEGAQQSQISDA